MTAMNRLQGLLLCGALAAFIGVAQAQTEPMDTTTADDQSAMTADEQAEALEKKKEAEAMGEMKTNKQEETTQEEEVRGQSVHDEEVQGVEISD
jgi:hypothetical protein